MNLHLHYHHLKKGIVLFLISYLFIAITYTFSQLASSSASISEMVLFRNFVGVMLALPWMLHHYPKSFKTSRIGLLAIRSLMGVAGIVCVFLALRDISLVNVTLLSNTAPLFVPLLVWIFLKKPIDHRGWPAIILGFLGVLLILNPTQGIFNPGALYALGNGLTTASTFLVVRMAAKTEQMHTLLFYYYLFGFLLFLPFNLFTFKMPDLTTFIELVLMGAFSYWGSALSFHALRYGKASQLAPFSYSGVVYAGIIQWIIWDKVPSLVNLIGILLTCAAGIYILLISRPPPDTPKLKF